MSKLVPLELQQKTPIRVLHRRSVAVRKRTVFEMAPLLLDNKRQFLLSLTTQAGTYIKEFVHGDFGRTRPSLAELLDLESVEILDLDVEAVNLDWPPGEKAAALHVPKKYDSSNSSDNDD